MAKDAKATKLTPQNVPNQVLVVLGVFLVILSIVLGYFGIYDPSQEKLQQAQNRLEEKEAQLEDLQQKEAEFVEYRKESERLERRLDDLKAKIPSTVNELDKFLQSVGQRARSSRVSKWLLYKQEGNIAKGDGIEAIPIRMEFEASYEAALQFFWELASMGDGVKVNNREQLINIHDVQMTRMNSGAKNSPLTMVKVNCVAETYLYTGNAPAAPSQKK